MSDGLGLALATHGLRSGATVTLVKLGMTVASASTQYASSATTPITAAGFTVCLSRKGTGDAVAAFTIGDTGSDDNYFIMFPTDTNLEMYTRSAATSGAAVQASGTPNDGNWHFCAIRETSTTSRHSFLDATKSTEQTTDITPAGIDAMSLGCLLRTSASLYDDATYDNVSVWSAALSDANYTWLRTGGNTGGPATYENIVSSLHTDNPGVTDLVAFWKLNETSGSTLVNIHNSGTHDFTTSGSPTLGAVGHVSDAA